MFAQLGAVRWMMFLASLHAGMLFGIPSGQAEGPPSGANADPKNEAKALLQRGARLLRDNEFSQALARFQEAYQLVPSPKIQFNFGLCYLGLARNAEALEAFEIFVAQAKDASPASLDDAREQIESLKGKVATITVTSDRKNAAVSIDGRSCGSTPLARPIYVDPGAHQVVVRDDNQPVVQTFSAFAGKSATIYMRFAPAEQPASSPPAPNLVPAAPAPEPTTATLTSVPAPAAKPYYKRPWVWGVVGAAVAAGVVTAVLLTRESKSPSPTLGSYPVN